MSTHHDVTVTQAPTPDGEGKGIQEILRVFMKNPVAAVEIIGFLGAMYGLYYTMNYKIDDAKASSEQHYKDLVADSARQTDKLNGKIDQLTANDATEISRIEAIYTRGDTRYSTIIAKLSEHDIDIAKMATGIDYLVRVIDQKLSGDSHDKHTGVIPSLPHSLAGMGNLNPGYTK